MDDHKHRIQMQIMHIRNIRISSGKFIWSRSIYIMRLCVGGELINGKTKRKVHICDLGNSFLCYLKNKSFQYLFLFRTPHKKAIIFRSSKSTLPFPAIFSRVYHLRRLVSSLLPQSAMLLVDFASESTGFTLVDAARPQKPSRHTMMQNRTHLLQKPLHTIRTKFLAPSQLPRTARAQNILQAIILLLHFMLCVVFGFARCCCAMFISLAEFILQPPYP